MPSFVHGRNANVLVNGYDLTAYLNSASTSKTADTAEVTAFSDTAKTYIAGQTDATVTLEGMLDDSSTPGADVAFNAALGVDGAIVNYMPTGDAKGVYGYGVSAEETSYQITSMITDANKVTASFQSAVGGERVVALAPLTARSGTQNVPSLDLGAGVTTAEVAGYLQVTSAVGQVGGTVIVQHSHDDSTFADLVTFTFSGGTTAQRVAAAGTVRRYARTSYRFAAGTTTFYTGLALYGEAP